MVLVRGVVRNAQGFADMLSPGGEHVVGVFHEAEDMHIRPHKLNEPAIDREGIEVKGVLSAEAESTSAEACSCEIGARRAADEEDDGAYG